MPGEWEKKIIKAGYTKLAERCHPDHGGKAEDMIALNAARDRLVASLEAPAPIPGQPINAIPVPPWPASRSVRIIPLAEALFGPGASALFSQGFTTIQEVTKALNKLERAQRLRRR